MCSLAAPFGDLLASPNRPKIDPSRLCERFFVEKCSKGGFSRNIGRRNVWSVFSAPDRRPKRLKIDPRRLRDDLKEILFVASFWTSFCVVFRSHCDSKMAPKGRPRRAPHDEAAGKRRSSVDHSRQKNRTKKPVHMHGGRRTAKFDRSIFYLNIFSHIFAPLLWTHFGLSRGALWGPLGTFWPPQIDPR